MADYSTLKKAVRQMNVKSSYNKSSIITDNTIEPKELWFFMFPIDFDLAAFDKLNISIPKLKKHHHHHHHDKDNKNDNVHINFELNDKLYTLMELSDDERMNKLVTLFPDEKERTREGHLLLGKEFHRIFSIIETTIIASNNANNIGNNIYCSRGKIIAPEPPTGLKVHFKPSIITNDTTSSSSGSSKKRKESTSSSSSSKHNDDNDHTISKKKKKKSKKSKK